MFLELYLQVTLNLLKLLKIKIKIKKELLEWRIPHSLKALSED